MTGPRILIAGIGNIFEGDDAFGVEVAQRLMRRRLPEAVRVVDFGIRSFDLAYALLDGPDVTIMVDATQRGGSAGTLYLIEPELGQPGAAATVEIETHGMNPVKVLDLVAMLGGAPRRLLVVGCEPAELGGDDGKLGLTEPVQAAVDQAVVMIETLIATLLADSSMRSSTRSAL